MKNLRIVDGQWRVQSQFDVYADGYYVATTRNTQGEGNKYDIDHAILIADAGNAYQATQMLPSEMAERIKALEDALRKLISACPALQCDDFSHDASTYHDHDEVCKPHYRYVHALNGAELLLAPAINEAHGHLLTNPE
jgi:hypothetical protein